MESKTRFIFAIASLLTLTFVGTLGYAYIEGWPFSSAFYMTIITLSTVGFREIGPLSVTGQWFTILLIIGGFLVIGFSTASITAFLVQGELRQLVKGRRMHHQIERLKDHYILCGCGAVGREIVQAFLQAKVPFVVLEKNPEDAEIPRELDILVVQGDATDEEDLAEAGITRAKGLISALHHDPDNVFVTLTARQLNPNLQIVSRASEKGTEAKLKRAGADRVISPYEIAGRRMASTVLQPAVVNFLDVIIHEEGMDLRLEEVSLDPSSPLVGQSLRQIDAAAKTGAIIVGVLDPHGTPRALTGGTQRITDLIFSIGDTLIALGSDGQINDLKKLAHV